MEGDRVIRISGSGTFSYTSGGETVLSVESAGGLPTPREAVSGVLELLDQLIPEGDAGCICWSGSSQKPRLS